MLHTLSKRIADFLCDEKDKYPLEVYTYGFELIISSVFEFLSLLIVGMMLNRIVETFVFVLSFSFLRVFTGGYHAKTYLRCAISTMVTFLCVIISYRLILINCLNYLFLICLVVYLISFYIIFRFAPIASENKEINNEKRCRLISIICLTMEAIIIFIVFHFFKIYQVLILIPTISSVSVLMLVEIIRKRGVKNETYSKNSIKRFECKGK